MIMVTVILIQWLILLIPELILGDFDERERFLCNAYEVSLSPVKHHVNTWHKWWVTFFRAVCPQGQMVLTCPPPAETGSVLPLCILLPTPSSLSLWADTADPVFSLHLWEYSGFVRCPNLLTCMYPRTLILSSDLFQCFEPQSSTPAQISVSGSPTLPTARQTHGCTKHTVSVCMLILCSPSLCSLVDHVKRHTGVCSVTVVTGFALITGSLKHFCSKNDTI